MSSAPVPPQNLDAEESVLGAVMLSPKVLGPISELIGPGDFYRESHAHVFRACLEMDAHGLPIDAITIVDWLDEHGTLEEAGGRMRVHELAALVPAASNAVHYAKIVREMSGLRGLISVGQEIARLGWERPGELENLNDRAEQAIFGVTQETYRGDLELLAGSVRATYERMESLAVEGGVVGLSTGFAALDDLLGGIQPGNLVIVAARPSMGKTALAHSLMAKIGVREKRPVALFSFEMSRHEVDHRLLSSGSTVALERLRRPKDLSVDEWGKLQQARMLLEEAPLYVDDGSDATLAEVRSKARRLKMRVPGLALLIVDYLQLMSAPEADNRNQEITKLSRGLKVLARQLEVPVVCLSQLSRAVEQRQDKRPILSDLRDSGSIEQDADIVLMLYRDDYYKKRDKPLDNRCEVHVAKHRNGPTGTVDLWFHKRQAKFQQHAEAGL